MRGAWIEMTSPTTAKIYPSMSLPMRGAWIEIHYTKTLVISMRRSPCGERGLK